MRENRSTVTIDNLRVFRLDFIEARAKTYIIKKKNDERIIGLNPHRLRVRAKRTEYLKSFSFIIFKKNKVERGRRA